MSTGHWDSVKWHAQRMSTATWRKVYCWLTHAHFWEEFQVARRCRWCGRIEVNRNALS